MLVRIAIASALVLVTSLESWAQGDDLFAANEVADGALDVELSEHPYGDTPLERMVALAHTDALPECDRVVVYAISMPKRLLKGGVQEIADGKGFMVDPFGRQAKILAARTLNQEESKAFCSSWRQLKFDKWKSAFCHYPAHGVCFYRNDKLIFQTSICWKCSNFYLADVSKPEPDDESDFGETEDQGFRYQWYGFELNESAKHLLASLQEQLKQRDGSTAEAK